MRRQRDVMRELFRLHAGERERVIDAYAAAERRGEAARNSNVGGIDARQYASRLYSDGIRKGWLR